MGRSPLASLLRSLLELPISQSIRSSIMERESRKDDLFTSSQAQAAGVRLLSISDLQRRLGPKSQAETFYILGSGASIEDLTRVHFNHIGKQASVGINNWGVHPFVPDIYSLESVPWVGDGQDFSRAMRFLDREDIYSRQPEILILRPKSASEIEQISVLPGNLRASVNFYGRVTPATREDSNLVGDIAEFVTNISLRYPSVILDSGASVVRMVVLGMLLGFRRIVMAGVDLNGSPYFWETNPQYVSHLVSPPPVNNQVSSKHETTSSSNRPFDAITMLRALDDFFRSERGGQLLVTSPNSALAEYLQLETWGKR